MTNLMLMMLAAFMSQPAPSTPAPPPALPASGYPSRATGSLSGLFTTDDYPVAALRKEEQGSVAISFAIDREGRVTNCVITTSSGSPSLDATTCELIRRRARFKPARDASGYPIEDRASHRIRWVLPPSPPRAFADDRFAFVFTIDAQKMLVRCRTEGNAKRPPDDKICPLEMDDAKRIVANAGQQVEFGNRELVLGQGVLIGGPDVAQGIGRRPDENLGGFLALALDIDAEGNVSRCVSAAGSPDGEEVTERCQTIIDRKFVPLAPAASDRSVRHAVKYEVIYTRPIR